MRVAMDVISEKGLEALSLRDVARRLKVSHQAPYKHYPTKDHLLAEVIRRCLTGFADALRGAALSAEGRPLTAEQAMDRLGSVYLVYALHHPLEYRLMFMTPWPEAARQVGLDADARAAFDVLGERLGALHRYDDARTRDRDAFFVWSCVHGIASILHSEAMDYLSFPPTERAAAVAHALERLRAVIAAGPMFGAGTTRAPVSAQTPGRRRRASPRQGDRPPPA